MKYSRYQGLSLRRERGVAFVMINYPPMNLLDVPLALVGQQWHERCDTRGIELDGGSASDGQEVLPCPPRANRRRPRRRRSMRSARTLLRWFSARRSVSPCATI